MMKVVRPVVVLSRGLWAMRDGKTARINRRHDIPYREGRTGKPAVYVVWHGVCAQTRAPMSWTGDGRFAAVGKHPSDILRRASPPLQKQPRRVIPRRRNSEKERHVHNGNG